MSLHLFTYAARFTFNLLQRTMLSFKQAQRASKKYVEDYGLQRNQW